MNLRQFILFLILFNLLSSCELFENNALKQNENKDKSKKVYNGVKKNYHNGKLASTVTYKDSLKNGPAKNYYPNGKVNMEFNYKNNLKHGLYKWYYENGKVYLEGNYKNGEKDGVFKIYRKNGTLKSEMPWSNGRACVGLKEYFESGNIKEAPRINIKKVNTIKLDEQYKLEISLSQKNKYAKFYEGYLEENNAFPDFFSEIRKKNGKAVYTVYVPRGSFFMKTITIIAKLPTKDKNYYILKKDVNVSVENR